MILHFNRRNGLIISKKLWLKLKRAGRKFFDTECDTFVDTNDHVCSWALSSEIVQKLLVFFFTAGNNSSVVCKLRPVN